MTRHSPQHQVPHLGRQAGYQACRGHSTAAAPSPACLHRPVGKTGVAHGVLQELGSGRGGVGGMRAENMHPEGSKGVTWGPGGEEGLRRGQGKEGHRGKEQVGGR